MVKGAAAFGVITGFGGIPGLCVLFTAEICMESDSEVTV